jgi:hypothetical protein
MPGRTRRDSRSRRQGRRAGRSASIVVLAASLAAPILAIRPGDAESSRVAATIARSSLNPQMRAALARALRMAVRKLSSAGCGRIFSEFADSWQSPPSADDPVRTEGTLFDGLDFRDGMPYGVCRDNRILAFTRPGSRSIYLCGDQFSHAAFINLEYAANILIHEGLHCLGLGEDPPSSKSITALVAADCPVPSEKPRIRPVGQDEGSGGRVP